MLSANEQKLIDAIIKRDRVLHEVGVKDCADKLPNLNSGIDGRVYNWYAVKLALTQQQKDCLADDFLAAVINDFRKYPAPPVRPVFFTLPRGVKTTEWASNEFNLEWLRRVTLEGLNRELKAYGVEAEITLKKLPPKKKESKK